ncbi:MAG: ATP-binding cassette domain-containing protein [Desulfuromonadales bacterium]
MPLISLRNTTLAYGGPPLLDKIDLQIDRGERICLLGRNGAGKSSLLGLIAGEVATDSGTVDRQQGLRVARLPQEVPRDLTGNVFGTVALGMGRIGEALCRHHDLSLGVADGREEMLPQLMDAQQTLENENGWPLQQRIEQVLSRLKLDADSDVTRLSGGMIRRVLLARALAAEPDILLLDEPTNHLDIDSIAWLEEFLVRESLTLVFVTHDRTFLRALATRIVEIDRGRLFDFACDYDTFWRRKEELLNAEAQEWARFDKKLAEEEIWIRRGIKARRTRNEGRVRNLQKMREQRSDRRERQGTARMQIQEADRSGRLVAEMTNVSFSYGETTILNDFSTTVLRGDRIGIIGPNGAGKTTLLNLLLGELEPQSGKVRLGTNLRVLYFDQLREQLDLDATVQQNIAPESDMVLVGGQSRHVIGYLKDFLFTPERARTPVRVLSGGERNRLLLARLFLHDANVLVLDEPTNDLDLETLDLLEELLADFSGTIFLVSHDRDFLNRSVTSTIAFEDDGRVAEYVGGYDDWVRQRPEKAAAPPAVGKSKPKPAKKRQKKLSFREKGELEDLPAFIERLEAEQVELHGHLADPDLYREAGENVSALNDRLGEIEAELETAYSRWEELEQVSD